MSFKVEIIFFFYKKTSACWKMNGFIEFAQTIKIWLLSTFEMKDIREAFYIFGVKIHRDRYSILVAL